MRAAQHLPFVAALLLCCAEDATPPTAPAQPQAAPPVSATPPVPASAAAPIASATPTASVTHPPPPTCPPWTPTTGGDFTPASLPNLALWLDTDPSMMVKDGGKTVWRDRTQHLDAQWGLGYCARGPEYVPDRDQHHGQLRYHESGCLAVIGRCPGEPGLDLGSGDFTLFVVAAYAIDGVLLTAFNQVPPESPNFVRTLALRGDATGLHVSGVAKVDAKGQWLGGWHIYGVERRGDKVSVSVDGAVKASATAKPGPTSASNFFLGLDETKANDSAANPYWLGFMGDVVGVKGALPEPTRSEIVAYLKKKFAPLVR